MRKYRRPCPRTGPLARSKVKMPGLMPFELPFCGCFGIILPRGFALEPFRATAGPVPTVPVGAASSHVLEHPWWGQGGPGGPGRSLWRGGRRCGPGKKRAVTAGFGTSQPHNITAAGSSHENLFFRVWGLGFAVAFLFLNLVA